MPQRLEVDGQQTNSLADVVVKLSRQPTPFVTTLHGRLDLPEHQPVFTTFSSIPLISISDSQRKPVPQAGFVATIHHGIPEYLLTPQPIAPSYLAFIGRISPE